VKNYWGVRSRGTFPSCNCETHAKKSDEGDLKIRSIKTRAIPFHDGRLKDEPLQYKTTRMRKISLKDTGKEIICQAKKIERNTVIQKKTAW
jgi:hypothetical protein